MESQNKKINIRTRYNSLSRLKKSCLWATLILIIYTVSGFFILPAVVKMVLEKKLSETLHRQAAIQKLQVNPYTLTTRIQGFRLSDLEGKTDFVAFDEFFVNLQIVSLFKRALIIESVIVSSPKIKFSHNQDLTYSFSDLLVDAKKKEPDEKTGEPFLFSINNIEIKDGFIRFQDFPKDKVHQIAQLNLAIPSISNLPYSIDNYILPHFSAVVNGTKVSTEGKTKPFLNSRETLVSLDVKGLNLPEYLQYIPNPTKVTLKSGTVDINANLSYRNKDNRAYALGLSGTITIADMEITDNQGKSYIRLPHTLINIDDSEIFRKEIRISSFLLKNPEIDFERVSGVDILPISLLASSEKEEIAGPEHDRSDNNPESSLKLIVDEVIVEKGRIRFSDETVSPFLTILHPVDVKIADFTTVPEKTCKYNVNIFTESQESLAFNGEFGLSPLLVDGTTDIKKIKLTKYIPYLKEFLIPDITDGSIDLSTGYHYSNKDQVTETRINNLSVTLTGFVLADGSSQKQIVSIPRFAIGDTHLNLEDKNLIIGDVSTGEADFYVIRDQGRINLEKIVRSKGKDDGSESPGSEAQAESEINEAEPWHVVLKQCSVAKYSFIFEDREIDTNPVTGIHDFGITVSDISTKENSTGNFSFAFKLNKEGLVSGKGSASVNPINISMETDIKKIALKSFQPYTGSMANLIIGDGAFGIKGKLDLSKSANQEFKTIFTGNSTLTGFKALESGYRKKLLSLKHLGITGIRLSTSPDSLSVKDISFKDIVVNMAVSEDGTLNVSKVKKKVAPKVKPKAKETKSKQAWESLPIKIASISFANGTVNFKDKSVKPQYSGMITKFAGTVKGLSSSKESLADVNLSAKINKISPVTITGKIAPLRDELFADLKIDVDDVNLSSISPYSGKYIGYKTDKGKLTAHLKYLVEGNKLSADNSVLIDQCTLGDSVDSPDAVSLPIRMAIALLKNREGEIHLDLPFNGDLDDPEFSVSGIVFDVLFNLIAKAATSPFALLGALIPDEEDIQKITFEPGISLLTEDASASLEKMAKVLYKRPGIKVDIVGKVAPVKDGDSLTKIRFDNLIRMQKALTLSEKKPKLAVQPETVTVTDEEYPRYLSRAYEADKKVLLRAYLGSDIKNNIMKLIDWRGTPVK